MLEKIFVNSPSFYIKDSAMEAELNDKWGSAFNIFQNSDLTTSATPAKASNALAFPTVWACINVLSDDIAKLPFKTFKKDSKGAIEQVKDNDVHYVLRIKPNRYMTPFTFMKLLVTDVCIHGNFYAYILRDENGYVEELVPLISSVTQPMMDDRDDLYYQTNRKGKNVIIASEDVLHIKGMTIDGIVGLSPIQAVRVQLESNDIAGKYNQSLIEDGGAPKGVLKVQGALKAEAKDMARKSWEEVNKGQSIAIIDSGLEYQQIGISQSDMQWLESMKFNQQQIASIFKVPMHKINELDKATYSNIEHQSLDYVKNTLQPWVTQIEEEFGFKLYTEIMQKQDYYVRFNMDSELRGDSEARAKVNEVNLRNGFKTVNEVRSNNEDSPHDLDIANKPLMSLNLAPLENVNMLSQNNFGKYLNGMSEEEPNEDTDEDDKGGEEDGTENKD